MKFICLSDTHGLHSLINLPTGDVLIHAGDFCNRGTKGEIKDFALWLELCTTPCKIVIAGNHDRPLQRQERYAREWLKSATYVQDREIQLGSLKLWGSPWQPHFGSGWAFNLEPELLKFAWSKIPDDVSVLVTHTPPRGILDEMQGCEALANRIQNLRNLKLHVFGHIHEGYGVVSRNGTHFVNASLCDEDYALIRKPLCVDLV